MSRTSDCEPNDTASPNTPAPAISGAVSTPSRDSTISAATTADHHAERGAQHRQHRLQPRGRGAARPRLRRRAAAGPPAPWQMAVDRQPHQLPGDIGDKQRPDRRRRPSASPRRPRHPTSRSRDPDPGERGRRDDQHRRRAGCGAACAPRSRSTAERPAGPVAIVPAALGQPFEHEHDEDDARVDTAAW